MTYWYLLRERFGSPMKHYSRQCRLYLDSKSRCEYPELLPWLHPHSPPNHIPSDNTDSKSTARSRRYVDSPQSQAKESLVSVAPNLHQQLYLANDASLPVNYCDGDTSLLIGPYQAVLLLPRIAKPPHETGVRLEWRLRLLAPDLDGIGGCQHSRLYL